MIKKAGYIITFLSLPLHTYAATFADAMTTFNDVINGFVPIILSLAVIYFLWGVTNYVRAATEPQKREEGRQMIIYGLIAIFVMVSMWALLISLCRRSLGEIV
jgi:uncharacterized membrane protein